MKSPLQYFILLILYFTFTTLFALKWLEKEVFMMSTDSPSG